MAETVSLGILSLPSVIATLGLAPGIIMILVMSLLSTYSGLMLGEFRKEYPFVENFGDAVEVMGKSIGMGPLFQEIFGWAQVVFQVCVMASHLLTWTICINTLTDSSTCTIIWAVVGVAIFWVLNLPRTLKSASWTSITCKFPSLLLLVAHHHHILITYIFTACISILVATLMTVGDVAVGRPIGSGTIEITRQVPFTNAFLAVTNIGVAFCKICFLSNYLTWVSNM